MEHRFTLSPDGSLAGAWWDRDNSRPFCIWEYDGANHLLFVERGSVTRIENFMSCELATESLIDDLATAARVIAESVADAAA